MENSVPSWWVSKEKDIQKFLDTWVMEGKTEILAISPGGRKIRAYSYGTAQPELRGKANFNSAIGSGNPDNYFKRGPGVRKHPVLMVIAGVHGQEVEGMVAALSLINIVETGKDLSGKEQPVLFKKLANMRLIIVPLANPDGRARVPYDGWVGLELEEMTKYGQGTNTKGELYRWRGSKAVHPMKGDVGLLGAYFDDNGVNMMHDDWACPMSKTTTALLKLAAKEGPDLLLNLHSHSHDPAVLPTSYIPVESNLKKIRFTDTLHARLAKEGYSYVQHPITFEEGPAGRVPAAMNLTSMLYHVGADVSITFESPHGVIGGENPYQYDDILKIHNILFHTSADYLESISADTP